MKFDKAWPIEEKIIITVKDANLNNANDANKDANKDAKVFPKTLIDQTVQQSIDSLLKQSFGEDEDPEVPKKNEIKNEPLKKMKRKEPLEFKTTTNNDIKFLWIGFGALFLLGIWAFNAIFFRLTVIETLISRRA